MIRAPAARALLAASLAAVSFAAVSIAGVPLAATAQTPSPMPHASYPPLRSIHIPVSAQALAGLPRRTIAVTEEHGGTVTYSGVDLGAVLARAGAPSGKTVGGPALAAYVLVRASDGYRAVFALPELDPGFTDRVVLLADQRDGAPLPAQLGPYRIVVAGEKRAARWVRNVTEIDFEPLPLP